MTSKIKVDNIENQCGGAVVTKCGGTTTISGTTVTATNVKSNALQASDGGNLVSQSGTTITLGASGDTINLASGASQSGFGRTGTVDWNTTPKTATFSAVSGDGFFCNTTGGAFTCNLPAGSAGAIVSLADYAGTWQTNALTVSANGSEKIGGRDSDPVLNTSGQSVTLVYVDSTQGWVTVADSTENITGSAFISATGGTITTVDTNFKVHTFTGPGTFAITAGDGALAKLDYMVIAGGGAGARGGSHGAGGGAGGYRESHTDAVSGPYAASPISSSTPLGPFTGPVSIPVTVGSGGAAVPSGTGNKGNNSVFSTITSTGGGGGGAYPNGNGDPGGSGGGSSACSGTAGTGNTPPTTPAQGRDGGTSTNGGQMAGGGGAGGVGNDAPGPREGGAGVTTSINGTPTARGGGGGGGSGSAVPPAAGGTGGGGAGSNSPSPGTNGTANTGGGGGGDGTNSPQSGAGGSGVVIIRYKFQ